MLCVPAAVFGAISIVPLELKVIPEGSAAVVNVTSPDKKETPLILSFAKIVEIDPPTKPLTDEGVSSSAQILSKIIAADEAAEVHPFAAAVTV